MTSLHHSPAVQTSTVQRLRNMVLAAPYGLECLLSLLDIIETEDVPSAAVPIGGSPKMLINPTFVKNHCETDEKLFTLVLHELHHVLLGHTRLFRRITPAHNIAFDAVINAMLCRRQPEPEWTALFRHTYRADVWPEALLRPPKGFPGTPLYPENMPQDIRQVIHSLYYSTSGTFASVFERIPKLISVVLSQKLLGNHTHDNRGISLKDDPALFAAIRKIVERWPQPPDPKTGRSLNDVITELKLTIAAPPKPDAVVRYAIHLASQNGNQSGLHTKQISQVIDGVWPGRDRRAFAISAGGFMPLLHRTTLTKKKRASKPVYIYIDVSGSMHGYRKSIAEAALSCQRWIHPEIFLFSTQIHPVTIKQLKSGVIPTTGGTAGNVVTAHINKHKPQGVVILTDGYVGSIPAKHHKACKQANIQVVLTTGGFKSDLESVTNKFHHLYKQKED